MYSNCFSSSFTGEKRCTVCTTPGVRWGRYAYLPLLFFSCFPSHHFHPLSMALAQNAFPNMCVTSVSSPPMKHLILRKDEWFLGASFWPGIHQDEKTHSSYYWTISIERKSTFSHQKIQSAPVGRTFLIVAFWFLLLNTHSPALVSVTKYHLLRNPFCPPGGRVISGSIVLISIY